MVGSLRTRHRAITAILSNNPVRARHRAMVSMLSASVRVLQPSPVVQHHGRTLSPIRIELSQDTGQTLWMATIVLGTAEEWLPIRIGDAITIDTGAASFALTVDQRQLDRAAPDYQLKAVSPVAKLGAPWVPPRPLGTTGLARATCETLLDQTIDWRLPDWALPASAADTEDTPLALAQKIAAVVGGVLESNPDGSLIARRVDPVSPPDYASATPAAVLSDDDLVSRTDSVGSAEIANRFVIATTSAGTEGTIQTETDPDPDNPDDKHRWRVRAYAHPWRALTLAHTGDAATQISAQQDTTEDHEELIEITDGTGRTKYPVASITSYSYQYANLGTLTADGTEITTATRGYSLVWVRYRATPRTWITVNPRDETIQFLATG